MLREFYQCPRCQRLFSRPWFWRGRCSDCRVALESWMPTALSEVAEHVVRARLPGISLEEGTQVWSVLRRSPSGLLQGSDSVRRRDLYVGRPHSGDVFRLERREQMSRAGVRVTSERAAFSYVRFLYGEHVHSFFHEQPRYVELSPEFSVDGDDYSVSHPSDFIFSVRCGAVSGGFELRRFVLSIESLPLSDEVCPLSELLLLKETVQTDGRYRCEVVNDPCLFDVFDGLLVRPSGYRQPARPGLSEGGTIQRRTRPPPGLVAGRTLRVGAREVTAGLRRGAGGW